MGGESEREGKRGKTGEAQGEEGGQGEDENRQEVRESEGKLGGESRPTVISKSRYLCWLVIRSHFAHRACSVLRNQLSAEPDSAR